MFREISDSEEFKLNYEVWNESLVAKDDESLKDGTFTVMYLATAQLTIDIGVHFPSITKRTMR